MKQVDTVAIPSYSEVLFLRQLGGKLFEVSCRNPFLFRGPIPTSAKALGSKNPSAGSQSLLIQRSYSYTWGRSIYTFELPSQSLLIQRSYSYEGSGRGTRGGARCRNPFLFRGPIPTGPRLRKDGERACRNPFLFRGPIPTAQENKEKGAIATVAIPSYSEVLFLHWVVDKYFVATQEESQSLLIQRSYSYFNTR